MKLDIELDGKEGKLNWSSQARNEQLADVAQEFMEANKKLDKEADDYEQKAKAMLGKLRRDQAAIIYEFDEGLPDKQWFERKEFPEGQHHYNMTVFQQPQTLISRQQRS